MKDHSLKSSTILAFFATLFSFHSIAQQAGIHYTVSVPEPSKQYYHVSMNTMLSGMDSIILKMPAWTPGYYQLMHYADKVENFKAAGKSGELSSKRSGDNAWTIYLPKAKEQAIAVSYDVKATHNFVAGNFVNEERAYLSPTGVFMYPQGMINSKVSVKVEPWQKWSKVATGLPKVKGQVNTFEADDFDILFDSPILMGNLDSLPSFKVDNKPHYFFAYKPGQFNRSAFMDDIKKIVTTASGIIGDVPYKDYSFLAIGPGGGGIEHLNSTSVAFDGTGLDSNRKAKLRLYSFLSHEYFHHYNVKRIRPIELGPFDYDKGSRTKMLWLSEGITVYYEPLILSRAGLLTEEEMLQYFERSIFNYESKPGRQFQTPADASYHTWEEGPFGRTTDEVNKTISPYDKGGVLGLLLDFKIRHETGNKSSLDNLMKLLYNQYYKKQQRGFTEAEFRTAAEKIATVSLNDFFDQVYTLKPTAYNTYLGYAGLQADTLLKTLPGNWSGLTLRDKNDSLQVTDVEWKSPGWEAGIRRGHTIVLVNGTKQTAKSFSELQQNAAPASVLNIIYAGKDGEKNTSLTLSSKKIIPYTITKISNPTPLQAAILHSWMKGK